VLKLLALVGVGHITVIDFDTISRSNLARMVLFREEDIGKPKVHVAAERLHEINPEVEVLPVQGDLRLAIGLGEYRASDLVLGCLDSVNARWALNRKCLKAGVEWIDGGISDFHGLVARYSPTEGACYECNFTPRTIERFNKRYSCPFGLVSSEVDKKVPTTAVTTSVIAAFQVQQALMMLHGIEDGLNPGERLTVYLKPYHMVKDKLPYNQECLAHETIQQNIPITQCSGHMTINGAIQEARLINQGLNTLVLPFELVVEFECSGCGDHEPVLRPKELVHHQETVCPRCGLMRTPLIVTTIEEGSDLAKCEFGQIGIPDHEILEITGNDNQIYLQFGSS
jgi:molybdopterin/thiamine biosynthesis adenylyltransferase